MSSIRISGDTSGYYDLSVPAVAGTNTIELNRVIVADASGNVGIGRSPTAGYKLDIEANNQRSRLLGTTGYVVSEVTNNGGSISMGKENSTGGDFMSTTGAYDSVLVSQGAVNMVFGTNNTERMRISSTGNVGIGTLSPDLKLDVTHNVTSEYVATFQNTADNLEIKIGTITGGLLNIQGANASNNAAYDMCLQAEGGNVGINDTTPTATLDILNNNVAQVTLNVQSPGSGDAHVAQISRGSGSHKGSGLKIAGANWTNGTNTKAAFLELAAGQYSGSNTKYIHAYDNSGTDFMVGGDGTVGIGTDSPSSKLTVDSGTTNTAYSPTSFNTASQIKINVASTQNNYAGIQFTHAGNTEGFIGLVRTSTSANEADFVIQSYTANVGYTEKLRIDNSGIVTMPYQPAFSVYANTNETTSSGASAPFNGIIFDQGGNYSTANRRFVAPVAGIYQFSTYGNVNGVSAGSPIICVFAVNGTYRGAYMYLTVPTGQSWILISGTQTIKLNASDYVEVKALVSMHWDYGSAAWSNFSGHLVG